MKAARLKMPEILKKAEKAMKAAIQQVMIEHKQKGLPIYVLEHNKIVRIPPHRLPSH